MLEGEDGAAGSSFCKMESCFQLKGAREGWEGRGHQSVDGKTEEERQKVGRGQL